MQRLTLLLGRSGSGGASTHLMEPLLRAGAEPDEPRDDSAHKLYIRDLLPSVIGQEPMLRCAASGRGTSSCRPIDDTILYGVIDEHRVIAHGFHGHMTFGPGSGK